jgi:hypothetical protein
MIPPPECRPLPVEHINSRLHDVGAVQVLDQLVKVAGRLKQGVADWIVSGR